MGRIWLIGIAIGATFAALAMSMVALGQELMVGTAFFFGAMGKSIAWSFFAIPVLMMLCGSPLLLMRGLFGWRLTLTQRLTPRGAFGIEELLLSTASIAALFAICQLTAAGYELPISTMLMSLVFLWGYCRSDHIVFWCPDCVGCFSIAKLLGQIGSHDLIKFLNGNGVFFHWRI